ncbi:MAG: dihydropteroate synthase [Prevotellaceae bacterium]|jgi:dihydropteroate synthase|nr:dihydropteroate synthase [Prevotellaceae bacterium]
MKHFLQKRFNIQYNGRLVDLSKPVAMGILNVTPDSFYARSRANSPDDIAARAHQILHEGGQIIDIGAYSSRPNAADVSEQEEIGRLADALEIIKAKFPDAIVSVDTFRSGVVQNVVHTFGPVIVNDISGGLLDDKMFDTVAKLSLPYILMHMRGTPQTMQQLTRYDNLLNDIMLDLSKKVNILHLKGVADVIIDPGFGFAKTIEQNFELLQKLDNFKIFELPLLVGLSRKSTVYKTLGVQADQALNGTTTLNTIALMKGANILRVHDVKAATESIKLVSKVTGEG